MSEDAPLASADMKSFAKESMSDFKPRITLCEWVSTGVMVHFEDGLCVFYSARVLYEQSRASSGDASFDFAVERD